MSTLFRVIGFIALMLFLAVFIGGTIGDAITAKVSHAIDNAIHYRNQ